MKKIVTLILTIILLGILLINSTFAENNNGTGIIITDSSYRGFDSRIISIFGENFGTGGEVILKSGTFKKIEWGDKKIIGELPINLSDTSIYIQNNLEKSNEYKIDIKLPHIDYIYGKNGFYNGERVSIFGKNLDFYKTTKIKIDDKIIDGNYNEFTLNNLSLGKHTIKIVSGGFESNPIEIDIFSKNKILKSVEKKYKNTKPFIELTFSDKLTNTGGFVVYNNSKIVNISEYNQNKIILNDFILDYPNNFFKLKTNNTYSNIINLKNNEVLPKIISLSLGSSFGTNKIGDRRIIDLSINNFDKSKDKIYYNDIELEVLSCNGNTCRVTIPYNSYKGEFSVGNSTTKNNLKFKYNIEYDNIPLIETLNTNGDLKAGVNFNIKGTNLDKLTISSTNLFLDNIIHKSYGSISSIVGQKYDNTKESTITFNSELWNKTITFKGSDFSNNKINGPSKIKEFNTKEKDKLFYPGTEIFIKGDGFHKGDIVNIGNYKINLNFTKKSFILPTDINPGEYNINIENINGIKSDDKKIIILEDNLDSINITYTNTGIYDFKTEELYKDEKIYSINIDNKIDDFYIKNIQFNVQNYNKEDYLGTFTLKIDGKEIGKSLINNKGEIIFENIIEIVQSIKPKEISLYKDSPYIFPGKYSIKLYEKSLTIFYKNTSYKKFSKIIFNNILPKTINISKKAIITCYNNAYINIAENNNCENINKDNKVLDTTGKNKDNNIQNNVSGNKEEVKKNKSENIKNTEISNTNILSVNNFQSSYISKSLIISKKNLEKDSIYRKYIKAIDMAIEIIAKDSYKIVKLYNKIEGLPNIKGGISKVIKYLKAKVDYEILNNDNILKNSSN